MKKLLGILVLGLLLIVNIAQAKIKNVGNGLTINIPNKYKYFELTFRQLISRFPEFGSKDQIYDDLGIGMGTKLIVIANNQKTINFVNDVTSVTGLEKLNRKHLQPMMKKFTDPKFIEKMMKDIQSIDPNADLENMSEEDLKEILEELSESPKMIKKYERIINPYKKKFNREYDLDKYTIILLGDKNAEYLEEIKDESISDLTQNLKDLLEEFYEDIKDPSLKDIRDWQFEIAKNHNGNLYLYSDDSLQSPYVTSRYYSETFWTTHNNKIFIASSICTEKCNASTDLLDVIKPTNLFVESNSIPKITKKKEVEKKKETTQTQQVAENKPDAYFCTYKYAQKSLNPPANIYKLGTFESDRCPLGKKISMKEYVDMVLSWYLKHPSYNFDSENGYISFLKSFKRTFTKYNLDTTYLDGEIIKNYSDKLNKNKILTALNIVKEPTQTDDSSNVVQQLKDLNELYESGALTEEEFKKAKKKLLN